MQIINKEIKELIEYSFNNKKYPEKQIDLIANSIKQFGMNQPIVIDKENIIIAGHGRVLACKKLGIESVPCVVKDDLTEAEIRAYRIVDNRLASLAEIDSKNMAVELDFLKASDFEFEAVGLDEIYKELNIADPQKIEVKEDDYEPTDCDPSEIYIKQGDLIELNNHRLICGDSSLEEIFIDLINESSVNLILTDPPYGIKADKGFSGSGGFGGFGEPIARRKYDDDWDSEIPEKSTFNLILSKAKLSIIWGGNYFAHLLPRSSHWLVWDKKNTMPTFSDCELAWTNSERKSVMKYEIVYNGLIGKEKERFHPTQKPVKLFTVIILDYTKENQIVLDPFLGSGTTLIACEQLNRTCYGIELDPKYCQVTIDRFAKYCKENNKECKIKINGEDFNV